MRVNLIGAVLNNGGCRVFDGLVRADDGRVLSAEESLHELIMEYARVVDGGESRLVTVPDKFLRRGEPR